MDNPDHSDPVIDGTVARLYSQDANDRVKAAAELGEIGRREDAPELLAVAYEDEASTVRQMAIQAYAEIMELDSIDELVKAAQDHFDEYVQLYAISTLGNLDADVSKYLAPFLDHENTKIQAATLRAMIHSDSQSMSDKVLEVLKKEKQDLIRRNCLEALTLWRYEGAMDYVQELLSEQHQLSQEVQTFASFYMASFGDKEALEHLKTGNIDEFIRINYNDNHYRGREGLLKLINIF